MTKTGECPYCFESLEVREIRFRCSGRSAPDGRRCAGQLDEIFARTSPNRVLVPPSFRADGRKKSAVHSRCGMRTYDRICPWCHQSLPPRFGLIKTRKIAVVGARQSGKTVYVTVLLNELWHKTGERLDLSVSADPATLDIYQSKYNVPIFDRGELPAPSYRLGQRAEVHPLVFVIGTGSKHASLLSFFDAAGEDLHSGEGLRMNERYLRSADGIMILLDPLTMPATLDSADPLALRPEIADSEWSRQILRDITGMIREEGKGKWNSSGLVPTPIAVIFSKLDALERSLPEHSALRRPEPIGGKFDSRDSLDVHEYMRAQLEDWQSFGIEAFMRDNYRTYRYFAVSALGASPTNDSSGYPRRIRGGVTPYRVTDPLLWLLSEFRAIPKTRG